MIGLDFRVDIKKTWQEIGPIAVQGNLDPCVLYADRNTVRDQARRILDQVEGKNGLKLLKNKIRTNNPLILYHGTLASMSATFVGHYPWFLTYKFTSSTSLFLIDKYIVRQFIPSRIAQTILELPEEV